MIDALSYISDIAEINERLRKLENTLKVLKEALTSTNIVLSNLHSKMLCLENRIGEVELNYRSDLERLENELAFVKQYIGNLEQVIKKVI